MKQVALTLDRNNVLKIISHTVHIGLYLNVSFKYIHNRLGPSFVHIPFSIYDLL